MNSDKEDENIKCYFSENENESIDFLELMEEFEKIKQEKETETENNFFSFEIDDIISEIKNYEINYTNKQLLMILEYYGLAKKSSHLKKTDMISYIMMFEKEPENKIKTMKRKQLWYYLNELKNDKVTRRFIIS